MLYGVICLRASGTPPNGDSPAKRDAYTDRNPAYANRNPHPRPDGDAHTHRNTRENR